MVHVQLAVHRLVQLQLLQDAGVQAAWGPIGRALAYGASVGGRRRLHLKRAVQGDGVALGHGRHRTGCAEAVDLHEVGGDRSNRAALAQRPARRRTNADATVLFLSAAHKEGARARARRGQFLVRVDKDRPIGGAFIEHLHQLREQVDQHRVVASRHRDAAYGNGLLPSSCGPFPRVARL